METLKLDKILPIGRSYYHLSSVNSLSEFDSDLRDAIEETFFFEGGKQAVNNKGIFIYQRVAGVKPQVSLDKLLNPSKFILN